MKQCTLTITDVCTVKKNKKQSSCAQQYFKIVQHLILVPPSLLFSAAPVVLLRQCAFFSPSLFLMFSLLPLLPWQYPHFLQKFLAPPLLSVPTGEEYQAEQMNLCCISGQQLPWQCQQSSDCPISPWDTNSTELNENSHLSFGFFHQGTCVEAVGLPVAEKQASKLGRHWGGGRGLV